MPTASQLLAKVRAALRAGFAVMTDEMLLDMREAFAAHGISTAAQLRVGIDLRSVVDHAAVSYARERAAELIRDFAKTTPEMMRATVARALEEGWSAGRLRDVLRSNYGFSPARALSISRTELARSRRAGGQFGAEKAGAQSKHWDIGDDEESCAECQNNAAEGWIPLDADFPSGDDPHPNCTCSISYSMDSPTSGDDADRVDDEAA